MELDAAGLVHRPVEAEVLERFLDCGDLHKGFARVYCDQCGHDYLLAYSCTTRYFCPSCHQKRMLMNHIPDKYEHLVRYYGYYSNRARGDAARAEADRATELYPVDRDRPGGSTYIAERLRVLAVVAETEELAAAMAEYLELEAKVQYVDYLLLDPVFDQHRDHPAIQGLVRQHSLRARQDGVTRVH